MKLKLETKINAIVNVSKKSDLVIASCDLNCTFGDYVNNAIHNTKGEVSVSTGQRLFAMLNADFKLDVSFNEKDKVYDVFLHVSNDSYYQIVTVR